MTSARSPTGAETGGLRGGVQRAAKSMPSAFDPDEGACGSGFRSLAVGMGARPVITKPLKPGSAQVSLAGVLGAEGRK